MRRGTRVQVGYSVLLLPLREESQLLSHVVQQAPSGGKAAVQIASEITALLLVGGG